jgi:predicted adenylyl cyclase CyaB
LAIAGSIVPPSLMLNETELKLQLGSEDEFNQVLSWCERNLGQSSRLEQRDEYYDTSTEDLRKQDLSLRLRTTNGTLSVAMKSPRVFLTETIHDRIELEFAAADSDEVINKIAHYRLSATAITEKLRWKFQRDDFKVLVDKLPFIGSFVEIEAPTVQRINEVVAMLGLSQSHGVNKNYSELIEEKLAEIGLPLRPNLRATFEDEAKWKAC